MAAVGFNWSKLNRKTIIGIVLKCKTSIANVELTPTQIQKILSAQIKVCLPIRIVKRLHQITERGTVYIGGAYYSDLDKSKKIAIELVLQYNPEDKKIIITTNKFKNLAKAIADTILHEVIHMRQYRSRKFKFLPNYVSIAESHKQRVTQNYLGCPDEIDAYGFNIACELHDKFKGDVSKIVTYLNNPRFIKRKNNWLKYLEAFDRNHNDPVIRKIKKRTIHYLSYVDLGKPYKTAEWINH